MIDLIIDIYSFDHQFAIIKGLVQSELLKQHMVTIGTNKQLSNSETYGYICLENIKKLYKSAGKCDDQQQYKDIIKSAMVYNPEVFIEKIPMSPCQSVSVKIQVQENQSIIFYTHWKSKLRLLSAGFVPLNQSESQSDISVCCVPVLQIGGYIQK